MGLYDPEAVRTFYNAYGEREWRRFEAGAGLVQHHVITRFLEDHVPAGARVLDAGCGPGRFALQCLARGCRLTLVDLSDAMLDEARQRIREAGLDGTHRCSYTARGSK